MTNLESAFHQAMLEIYDKAISEVRYRPGYFRMMLEELGGVKTAVRLLSTQNPQYGFDRLWESGRMDLTVEYHVLQPRFQDLFEEDIRSEASRRLEELGYRVDEHGELQSMSF